MYHTAFVSFDVFSDVMLDVFKTNVKKMKYYTNTNTSKL